MTALVNSAPIDFEKLSPTTGGTVYVFATIEEIPAVCAALGIDESALAGCREYTSTRYDYGQGFDYLVLNVPDYENLDGTPGMVEIYCTKTRLVFFNDGVPEVDSLAAELRRHHDGKSPAQVLYRFFSKLVENDGTLLNDMEEKIADLEDTMMAQPPEDCTAQISQYRHDLLVLKRYYEALFDALQDMEDNENGLYTKAELRVLRMCTARVDRLSQTVMHLRDYVTQVRESYQAQLDIGLNQTMKILTVVTTIFSPLTLLVGWYGMNLLMPEYNSAYAYPIVIGISLAVVVTSVVFFRKRNWF